MHRSNYTAQESRYPPGNVVIEAGPGLEDALEETVMGDGVEGLGEIQGHDGCAGWGLGPIEAPCGRLRDG